MKIEKRMVPEFGVEIDGVWIPYDMLEELQEQGPWDSQSGNAYIRPDSDQERVLIARHLAISETKGGLHRGPELAAFMKSISWDEEIADHPRKASD